MNERYIKPLIFLAATVWTIVLFISYGTIQPNFLKPLSMVITIVVYVALAFDKWIWRWPGIRLWVKRPVLNGTWKVAIQSAWIDPTTGTPVASIEAFMVVRQTLSTLSMRLLTHESSSALLGTEIVRENDGLFRVVGVYQNEPSHKFRGSSAIHNGALILQLMEDPEVHKLEGHYWTDRTPPTTGSLFFTDHITRQFQSFEAAEKYYSERES